MGFEVFNIVLDQDPVYIAGQTINGSLKVMTLEDIDCREIKVWVKGKAKVRWTTGSGKNRKTHRAEEEYFKNVIILWRGADTNNKYNSGTCTYPFSFILPPNIPSSFASPYGQVIYKVKAQADLPFRFDQNTQSFFSVNYLYDLNRDSNAPRPFVKQKEKTVCCLCCAQGPISLDMRAERTGYVPGESVVVDGQIFNGSGSTIEYTEIKLEQIITYIARSRKKVMPRTVQRVYHPQLQAGKKDVWEGVPLPIPPVPASHLLHCNIITIDYVVTMVAKLGTCRRAKVCAAIVIGSVPLRGTYTQFRPATPTRFGYSTVATSIRRSPRSSPLPFNPDSPLPQPPAPSAPTYPLSYPYQPPIPSLPPPIPAHSPGALPVPSHLPYSDPPPPYSASVLPDEYRDVPPPSYSSCAFGSGAGGSGGGGGESDASDDEGGFSPQYLTYRTNV